MTELRWLQQTSANVPLHDAWLCPAERLRLAQLRVPKRRSDWRLGRWTVKCAVASYLGLPNAIRTFATIAVKPAATGAPRVFIGGDAAEVAVSLSHCDGVGLCAVARHPVLLGCDLEKVEPRDWSFVRDYFTQNEQDAVAACENDELRASLITLVWSAKEAVLKALETGLRADTRSLTVSFADKVILKAPWQSLTVCANNRYFKGCWKQQGSLIYCFASDQLPLYPRTLERNRLDDEEQ